MDIIVTLFYWLLSACIVYPPSEFVSAGFTIAQIFEGFLGSENTNFILYHMKRTTLTVMVHSTLPLGYVFSLWAFGGWRSEWVPATFIAATLVPLLAGCNMVLWWEYEKHGHPVVKTLLPYVRPGTDWRIIAAEINNEFKNVDKVSIPLTATSKFVATETWLIKVTQYSMSVLKQGECTLVAMTTDIHDLTPTGELEIQYVNIEAIPTRDDLKKFMIRVPTQALRDLQPRLVNPVRVPDHVSLLPTLVEKFITVFKEHVNQNPVYTVEEELEQCIGCMQATADVKINRRCLPPPPHLSGGPAPCAPCNCRALWCAGCVARWWAARAAPEPPERWLSARCTCPVCRATFCLLDVCPVRRINSA